MKITSEKNKKLTAELKALGRRVNLTKLTDELIQQLEAPDKISRKKTLESISSQEIKIAQSLIYKGASELIEQAEANSIYLCKHLLIVHFWSKSKVNEQKLEIIQKQHGKRYTSAVVKIDGTRYGNYKFEIFPTSRIKMLSTKTQKMFENLRKRNNAHPNEIFIKVSKAD